MKNINKKKLSKIRKAMGLGDTIAQITEATGIDKAVKFIAGEDCGCKERQEKLNELFPYKNQRNPRCMTEQEFNDWKAFREAGGTELTQADQDLIVSTWNGVFQTQRIKRPGKCCPEPWQDMIAEVNQVFETYEPEASNISGLV